MPSPVLRRLRHAEEPVDHTGKQLPCPIASDKTSVFIHSNRNLHDRRSIAGMIGRVCNGIYNHTSLCEFYQGRLLLHLTIPFEEKPKTSMPSDNLRYYRQRNNLTTRQLAEQIGVVPATIVMYENGKHPIPYDVAIKLADVLKIEVSCFMMSSLVSLLHPIPRY